jgi:chromosome segregation ATPase
MSSLQEFAQAVNLTKELDDLEKAYDELDEAYEELDEQNDATNAKNRELELAVSEMAEGKDDYERIIAGLKQTVSEKINMIDDLENTVANMHTQLAALGVLIKEFEKEKEEQCSEIALLKQDKARLEHNLSLAEEKLSETQVEIEQYHKAVQKVGTPSSRKPKVTRKKRSLASVDMTELEAAAEEKVYVMVPRVYCQSYMETGNCRHNRNCNFVHKTSAAYIAQFGLADVHRAGSLVLQYAQRP